MIVTVELPSGEIRKIEIEPETKLLTIVEMLELVPENSIFFIYRYDNGTLGTLMGSADEREFQMFNTTSCAIVDKTTIRVEDIDRFNEAMKQGY